MDTENFKKDKEEIKETKDVKTRLSETLKEARDIKGYSQRELAELINVSYQTILNYEHGNTFPPRESLYALVKALDINLDMIKEKDEELYNFILSRIRMLMKDKNIIEGDGTGLVSVDVQSRLASQQQLNESYMLGAWIDIPIFAAIGRSPGLTKGQTVLGQTKIPSDWYFKDYRTKTFFGMRLEDDRNYPYMIPGDLLIIEEVREGYLGRLKKEEYVLYQLNGSEARVGKYTERNEVITIKFFNQDYRDTEVSVLDTLNILGIVKEIRRTVK